MASSVRSAVQQVKPILSINSAEARRRVLNLYRAWYRQIPYIKLEYDIPQTPEQIKTKLREEFLRYENITDLRIIDILVIKGQMELKEVVELWKNTPTLMYLFKDTVEKKPKDFLSKFLSGHD